MSTRLNLFAVISFLFLTVACSEDNTTVEPEQTTYSLTLITEAAEQPNPKNRLIRQGKPYS